jgi:hypothetical protein
MMSSSVEPVIALLSYLVHVHSHLRPSRQGLEHVGPITWEGCHKNYSFIIFQMTRVLETIF